MNILITNISLDNYAGTECYVRDISMALKKHGISIEIYSSKLGKVAHDLIRDGINVIDCLDDLKNIPDLIHGHHALILDAIDQFPNVPALFFCHSGIFKEEEPVMHDQIKKYIAVDHFCVDRIRNKGVPEDKIQVIHNWIDIDRFKQKTVINNTASNISVFSNYATHDNFFKVIKNYCETEKISLSGIGWQLDNHIIFPEEILPYYDIVFAKAKCAMEAMACGCAVILCNDSGMGEMVTLNNFDYYRKYNFGFKCLTNFISENNIGREIKKYDPVSIKQVSDKIKKENNFVKILNQIIDLYSDTINANKI